MRVLIVAFGSHISSIFEGDKSNGRFSTEIRQGPYFFFFFQIFFRVAQGAQILGPWSPGRLNCARLRTVFNYCSLSLAYEDACQFIYPEEKVPHNSEVRRSLQNFESLVLKSLHPSGVYNFGEARRFLENLWTLGLASYPLLINSSKEVKPIGKLLLARR